ncbi:fimbrillin family protein [Dysgonomonas massiliensis]|uniref:fimbrillin family protein n=1 Tax=Dysgonomonas massiliensis TaxID=2040292 RepID=UPI000C791CCB|nr:fimbrillin family protein [Dysgonomonas massiliensis]
MKIRNLFFTAALASLAFTACSSDDECTGYNGKDDKYVKFAGSIGEQMTKAAGTEWGSGDAIGVYMKAAGADLGTASDLNVRYTTTGDGIFTAATQGIELPADGSKVDFVAYYPQQATINDFKYPINVADQTSLPNIDLLYSNNAVNADKNNAVVQMNFKHMLSQLILNVTPGDGVSSLNGLSLNMADVITDGTFDLKNGTTTIGTTKATISPAVNVATGASVNAILVPGQDLATTKLTFTLDGRTYVWTPDAQVLEAGKKYTYNIQLSLTGLTLLSPNATIEDWIEGNTGGDITLTPDENPGFVVDKPTISFDETTTSSVVKLTAPATEAWTATASETWLTATPASGTGSTDITIATTEENTTGADRTASITIASSSTTKAAGIDPITITVTQKAKSQGEEKEFFNEGFGERYDKPSAGWSKISAFTGWEMTGVTYSDKYNNADIRNTSTMDNALWLPANKDAEFHIDGIETGYTGVVLSFDMAAQVASTNASMIQVLANGTPLATQPDFTFEKTNTYTTITLDIPDGTTSITFYGAASVNTKAFRIDNIILTGKK